LKILKSKMG